MLQWCAHMTEGGVALFAGVAPERRQLQGDATVEKRPLATSWLDSQDSSQGTRSTRSTMSTRQCVGDVTQVALLKSLYTSPASSMRDSALHSVTSGRAQSAPSDAPLPLGEHSHALLPREHGHGAAHGLHQVREQEGGAAGAWSMSSHASGRLMGHRGQVVLEPYSPAGHRGQVVLEPYAPVLLQPYSPVSPIVSGEEERTKPLRHKQVRMHQEAQAIDARVLGTTSSQVCAVTAAWPKSLEPHAHSPHAHSPGSSPADSEFRM